MERPSHLYLHLSHSHSGRMIRLSLAAAVPVLALWGLVHGMAGKSIPYLQKDLIAHVDEAQKPKPLPPPPPIPMPQVPQVKAIPPVVVIEAPKSSEMVITGSVVPAVKPAVVQTVGESHAAVAVAASHTIPPYPLLAQRQGLEGKVTLRLAVLADGHVGSADVVTSSGSDILDRAAMAWIVAHWLYKPALDKGQAVASQTVASVVFNLAGQR